MYDLQNVYDPIPQGPEEIQQLVQQICKNFNCRPEPVITAFIGVLGTAFQNLAYVSKGTNYNIPLNIFVGFLGGSGTSKTPVLTRLNSPVQEFQHWATDAAAAQQSDYETRLIVWTEQRNFYSSEIRRCIAEDTDYAEFQLSLQRHLEAKPQEPPITKLLLGDATPEAVVEALRRGGSACWLCTEGKTKLFQALSGTLPNTLFDSNEYTVDRVSSHSYVLRDTYLSISFQVQPDTFYQDLGKEDHLGISNGTWARFLMCMAPEQSGPGYEHAVSESTWEHFEVFREKITTALKSGMRGANGEKPMRQKLVLSEEALLEDVRFHNYILDSIAPGGRYQHAKEAGRKIRTNTIKLAGLLHCYCGKEGPISVTTYRQAGELAEWYLRQQNNIIAPFAPVPPEVRARQDLIGYLAGWAYQNQSGVIPKGYLLSYGPKGLRKAHQMDAALMQLQLENMVFVHRVKKASWVLLNPAAFQGVPPWALQTLPPFFQLPPTW